MNHLLCKADSMRDFCQKSMLPAKRSTPFIRQNQKINLAFYLYCYNDVPRPSAGPTLYFCIQERPSSQFKEPSAIPTPKEIRSSSEYSIQNHCFAVLVGDSRCPGKILVGFCYRNHLFGSKRHRNHLNHYIPQIGKLAYIFLYKKLGRKFNIKFPIRKK